MSTSHLSRAAVGVAALLLAVVVSGCEEDEPATSPTPSSSPSESETSSPSEPTTTDTGKRLSPVETVNAWVAAHNSILGNGDPSRVDALTGPNCATCRELRDSVRDVYRAGGHFRGGRWTVDAAEVTDRSSAVSTVTAGVTIGAGTTKSSDDAEPSSYPEEKVVLEFQVGTNGDRPLVTRIVFLS
jgi:hypothetical protein